MQTKNELRYEIVIFRRNDLFSLLERMFLGQSVGMVVRALGEKLTLPNDAEIIDHSGYVSSEERWKVIENFEKKYRVSKFV